jgi:hypothetical protein
VFLTVVNLRADFLEHVQAPKPILWYHIGCYELLRSFTLFLLLHNPDVQAMFSLLLVLLLFIIYMQGIYNYIPETSHVSVAYSVASVLYLQFKAHVRMCKKVKVK